MKKQILYFSVICLLFASCKKIIDVDTKDSEPQLVIEGNITDKFVAQQIKISKSISYKDQDVFPAVSGATVTVTDNRGNKYIFKESAPGLYVYGMRGTAGVTYTMQVDLEGATYSAVSKMPASVKLDSIGISSSTFFKEERKNAVAYIADPVDDKNFYHFNLYINEVLSNRIYVDDDRLINGNRLRVQLYSDSDDEGLKKGDKILVEMECIDANVFNYWYALSQQAGGGPNQGTTPSNPTSNISNGALGYFSAHTLQKLNITTP